MSSQHPLVSVLTPSFNQARWLQDNLDSVQAQTYPNIEQIVMDAGSTDGTIEILERSASNVRWFSEPDRGQSHALNKALDQARGEIIAWINSDDAFVDRRAIAAAVEVLRTDPDVGAVYGHGLVLNETNEFMLGLWTPRSWRSLLRLGVLTIQPSVVFRRSVLPNPFLNEDLHYVMDWSLFLTLEQQGVVFERIDYVIGVDREQPDRKTDFSNRDAGIRETRSMLKGVDRRLGFAEIALRRLIMIARRLIGIPLVVRLPDKVDPAIPIDFLSAKRRLMYQTMYLRRQIPRN